MEGAELAVEFFTQNVEKILSIGRQALGGANEITQIKLRTAYKDYLSATQIKYSRAKSFFIRHEPVDLYTYYEPTGIACGKRKIETPSFIQCVEVSNRVILSGSGGSGKSVALRHLFLDCIRAKQFVPVMVELRDLNDMGSDISLDDAIDNTLNTFGFNTSGTFVKRAKEAGHFCFFFDGYDEVNPALRKKVMDQISSLSKKFVSCPVFLTSRPDDILSNNDEFSIFQMLPLELESALRLIAKLPFDQEIKDKFSKKLEDGLFQKHQSFLSNPLLLSIMLLTYGENAEIPTKLSIFYNQAYEALFQRHDANKGGYSRKRLTDLDIQDFSRVFALFALQTYEKRLFRMSRTVCLGFIEKSRDGLNKKFKAEHYLRDLLSAACLLVEDGLDIAFSHRSFQEYFVALQICSAAPQVQEKLLERYAANIESDNVISLLLEMNPDLIEREVFLPGLKKLYSEIGVKKSVGITHFTRYLKLIYSDIHLQNNGIRATLNNSSQPLRAILRLAVQHCSTFKNPSPAKHQQFNAFIKQKYLENDNETRFDLQNLNYRSPLIVDLAPSGNFISIAYITAGYDAYKELSTKHANTVQSLDTLLGIR